MSHSMLRAAPVVLALAMLGLLTTAAAPATSMWGVVFAEAARIPDYPSSNSTLLDMVVTTVPGGARTSGSQYRQIAVDGNHHVLYQAAASGVLMFDMQTARWATLLDGSTTRSFFSVCVSADGATVYASGSDPSRSDCGATVYKLTNATVWEAQPGDPNQPTELVAGGPYSVYRAGYPGQSQLGKVNNMQTRSQTLVVGTHQHGSDSFCIWQLDVASQLLTQYVCDCSTAGNNTTPGDGVNNTARCGQATGLAWKGIILYAQEYFSGFIRKVTSRGGETTMSTVMPKAPGGGLHGILLHPDYWEVTFSAAYGTRQLVVRLNQEQYFSTASAASSDANNVTLQDAKFYKPWGLALDSDSGKIWISTYTGQLFTAQISGWATDAPVTNAPATDAPATNAPATDSPATGAPATDAPASPTTTTTAADSTSAIQAELVIGGQWTTEMITSLPMKLNITDAVTSDLASQLQVSESAINVTGLALGSLKIQYTVTVTAGSSEEADVKTRIDNIGKSTDSAKVSFPALWQSYSTYAKNTASGSSTGGEAPQSFSVLKSTTDAAPGPANDNSTNNNKGGLGTAVIIGIVVGAIIVVLILLFVVVRVVGGGKTRPSASDECGGSRPRDEHGDNAELQGPPMMSADMI